MNRKVQTIKYITLDVLSAIIAWTIFFIYRKYTVQPEALQDLSTILKDSNLYLGISIIPSFWVFCYYLAGNYRNIYRKSRLQELNQIFIISLIGVLIIFFSLILDDIIISYKSYYKSFLTLFALHFLITYFFRFLLTTRAINKIRKGKIGFNTIIIGGRENALNIYNQMSNPLYSTGQIFKGFVHVEEKQEQELQDKLPHLGSYKELQHLIKKYKIEEIIIATESHEKAIVEKVISNLEDNKVIVKIIPQMHDYLVGFVKAGYLFGTPLIQISPEPLPIWQQFIKRLIDIVFSVIAIVLLSPIYLFATIMVKLSSPGPIIYSQERIGKGGKPFLMHKFRSMYQNAESMGTPQLSSDNDPRITKFGKFMRKTRVDELPQFFTVLKGDMSIVGPRPERQYFIDKITERAPHYKMLQRIKPGITSWGQVKFGYASNVDEMIERLKYDILYLENMSLAMDFKIMIYTALIVLQGRGK